jgi:HD-GYP domain-containing protein (c-di-GMP phosphodiesterase class II)
MDKDNRIKELETALARTARHQDELSALLYSTRIINSSIDLYQVLDHLMDLAKNVTRAGASSALLLEDDKLCFVSASGTKSVEIRRQYLHKHEGIAGHVVRTGKPLIVADVSSDPRFSGKMDKQSGFVTHSILAVPLKIENEIIGVVEAVNKIGGGTFKADDEDMLSRLADSAAMAIHKARLFGDLNELFLSTIKAMANAIEAKDPYTRGHSERIRDFSVSIARELGVTGPELKNIEISALLHDTGKIGVPESVLRKHGKLSDEEFGEMKKHPVIGAEMLSSIKQLNAAIPGIRHHQECFNGMGYPDGLKGQEIPFIARIIAVADTFDAMTSDRPYRTALADDVALAELRKFSGQQFDPECVKGFERAYMKGAIISHKKVRPQETQNG